MNIGGLSISAQPVRASSKANRCNVTETKYDDSVAQKRETGFQNNAARQRESEGVDESRYVLAKDHTTADHDTRRFGYRALTEAEKENGNLEACGVSRAKYWSVEVENMYRLQSVGWRDMYEYVLAHDQPEIWLSNGLISKVYVKKTGFITYWGEQRECPDNKLHLVKLFKYKPAVKGGRGNKK